jgi:hypothetical protein
MIRCERILFVAVVLIGGCSGGAKTANVSGTVMLDGKPLANAHVVFQPVATGGKQNVGMGSYGVTDANGSFALRLVDSDQPGAVVGTHRVEINTKSGADDDRDPKIRPPQRVLPAKYNRETTLQFKVEPGGSTAANFELKSS